MSSAYTPDQITAFLEYIGIPQKYRLANNPPRNLAFLTALHIHSISSVPYENLSLHYNHDHAIRIDPPHLFQKVVVENRGRGGYCMKVSILFNHILRGLGFQVYTAGARIRLREAGVPAGPFVGWRHIVNIVTLTDGSRYMLDVGFGGDGATKPLPLVSGHALNNLGMQEVRLLHDFLPNQTLRTEATKMWIYQYRNSAQLPWNSFYAFPDLEFFETDFHIMNWYTSANPESFQVTTPLIVKFLRRKKNDYEDEYEIYGKRMLVHGTIKENLGGKTKAMQECRSEEERVRALLEHFDIRLCAEEMLGIIGHPTELGRRLET